MNIRIGRIIWLIGAINLPAFADVVSPAPFPDLSVAQVLRMAEVSSPDLKAAVERESAAEQNIRVFKSYYYPTFNAEAITSFGFPGSSRDLGISGLMGSPYRSGPAGGMTGNLELFDAGRRYAVETAKKELESVRARTQIVRYQIDQRALGIFLDASRFRGQEETSIEIRKEILGVEKEVNHYVNTGQRSVVEKLLVHDQTADAQMTAASFHERYAVALERLAVVTTSSAATLSIPVPQMVPEGGLGLIKDSYQSPLVLQAVAEAAVAHAAASENQTQNYPKLMATASVGDMNESRLVSKKYYSGGFGFQLPLFEGGRIDAAVRQAEALASARDSDRLAVQMDIDQINAHYDEIIRSSRVKLDYLQDEVNAAGQAFRLAKERYFNFQGTLVDLREAIRNLSRVQSEIIDVKTDLLLAVGSKALLNGARIQ
jgi:outer membrane protein